MFLGHFGAGLGAKAVARRTSLGALFLGAQFLDLLWPVLVLLGVERVRIVPGTTRVTPLLFEHYPVSHSLLAVIAWGAAVGAAYLLIRRQRRGALVIGLLVASHWVLDLVVHRPDLPLTPGGSARAGLGLWASLPGTVAVELSLLSLGVWLYARATRARDRTGSWGLWGLVALLLAAYAASLLGPPPPNAQAIGWAGQAQWLFVLGGYWVDRHRRVLGDAGV